MARTATTTDVFAAIGEQSRRDLLSAIGADEVTVGELVERVGLQQPQVSKHLGVLRAVDLVSVRPVGRQRYYSVNGRALKPLHDWVSSFEATWNQRLDRLEDLVTELAEKEARIESTRAGSPDAEADQNRAKEEEQS